MLHVHAHTGHGYRHGHGLEQGQWHGRMEANILKQIDANLSKYFVFRFPFFRSEYFEANILKRIEANIFI
jgi:hypothetical protein